MDEPLAQLPLTSPVTVHNDLTHLRGQAPICPVVQPSGDAAWLVTRHDDVKAVYLDERFSRDLDSVPGRLRSVTVGDWSDNPHSMINMEGEQHRRRRKPIAEYLTARRVQQFEVATQDVASRLLSEMHDAGTSADLVSAYAAPFPMLAIGEVLGFPQADREALREQWWPVAVPDRYPPEHVGAAYERSGAYVAALVAERRKEPHDDLISWLVQASDAGVLAEGEVVVAVYEVLFGTVLNTKSILATALLHVLSEPELYNLISGDLDSTGAVVDEILRLHPHPMFGLLRVATEDVELAGTLIRRGEGVLPGIACANRDPAAYSQSDQLRLDRSDRPSATFGFGRHRCVGAALGYMYVGVGLATLARRFPKLRLACDPSQVPWHNSFYERSPAVLPVAW